MQHQRTQKRLLLNADREAMRHKREKTIKMKYYGVLGLDPIVQDEDTKVITENTSTKSNHIYSIKAKFGLDDHAFGLDDQLFTPKWQFDKHHHAFQEMQDNITLNLKIRTAHAKDIRNKRIETERKKDDALNKQRAIIGLAPLNER